MSKALNPSGPWRSIAFLGVAALLAGCSALAASRDVCPVPDESLCSFVRLLEGILEAQDGSALLDRTDLRCRLIEGWNEDEAQYTYGDPGVQSGRPYSEGVCMPVASFVGFWSDNGPYQVRYLIYPRQEDSAWDGPAMVVRTGHPERDRLVFLEKTASEWRIVADLATGKRLAVMNMTNLVGWPDPLFQWYGMLARPVDWRLKDDDLLHRSISGCRLSILDRHPFDGGRDLAPNEWQIVVRKEVNQRYYVRYWAMTLEPTAGMGRGSRYYYSLYTRLDAPEGLEFRPLGYVWLEGPDPDACAAAAEDLIDTLDPARFPDLDVPLGVG